MQFILIHQVWNICDVLGLDKRSRRTADSIIFGNTDLTQILKTLSHLYASSFVCSLHPSRRWSIKTRVRSLIWKTWGEPTINSSMTTPTLQISYLSLALFDPWNQFELRSASGGVYSKVCSDLELYYRIWLEWIKPSWSSTMQPKSSLGQEQAHGMEFLWGKLSSILLGFV